MRSEVALVRRAVRPGPHVVEALATGRPVVALESTLVAHGLPRPDNLAVAREAEAIVRAEGAVPATVGVIGGTAVIGLDADELARIATRPDVPKLSVRDLPIAVATGSDGATTVASTAFLAAGAGIRLFATGGLGGVHREAHENWDESADLLTLSRIPIAVVCSGSSPSWTSAPPWSGSKRSTWRRSASAPSDSRASTWPTPATRSTGRWRRRRRRQR